MKSYEKIRQLDQELVVSIRNDVEFRQAMRIMRNNDYTSEATLDVLAEQMADVFAAMAQKYGLTPEQLNAVICQEFAKDPK